MNGPFRRTLIAVDPAAPDQRVLSAAVDLAQRIGGDLAGLFVEDIDLLSMAGLPFTRVVGHGPAMSQLTVEVVERTMRRRAREARASIESAASARKIVCSFRTTRGPLGTEISSALHESEDGLLIIEHETLKRTGLRVLLRNTVSVLCIGPEAGAGTALHVVYRRAPGDERYLRSVAHIAGALGRSVTVYPQAETDEAATNHALATAGLSANLHHMTRVPSTLDEALPGVRGGILVLRQGDVAALGGDDAVVGLARRRQCSLLLLP